MNKPTTQDILDTLTQYKQRISFLCTELKQSLLDLDQQTLLNLAMFSPTSESIAAQLMMLKLQGYIESTAGGCYIRVK